MMKIKKVKDNLGYYFTCNNSFCIGTYEKYFPDIKDFLDVEIIKATVGRSQYVGLFGKIINNVLVVSDLYPDEEYDLKNQGIEVLKLESKYNVVGNFILEFGNKLFTSPLVDADKLSVLNKEIIKVKDELIGSKCISNSKGILVSPLLEEEDYELLKSICKNIDVSTLGFGNPFLSSCVIMNDKGALIEQTSTSIELSVFENIFL